MTRLIDFLSLVSGGRDVSSPGHVSRGLLSVSSGSGLTVSGSCEEMEPASQLSANWVKMAWVPPLCSVLLHFLLTICHTWCCTPAGWILSPSPLLHAGPSVDVPFTIYFSSTQKPAIMLLIHHLSVNMRKWKHQWVWCSSHSTKSLTQSIWMSSYTLFQALSPLDCSHALCLPTAQHQDKAQGKYYFRNVCECRVNVMSRG